MPMHTMQSSHVLNDTRYTIAKGKNYYMFKNNELENLGRKLL